MQDIQIRSKSDDDDDDYNIFPIENYTCLFSTILYHLQLKLALSYVKLDSAFQ